MIVVALFLGGSIISDGMSKSAAGKRQQEAEAQRQAAEAAFVVPQPEKRGLLPVIGYFADPTPTGMRAYVYYLAPGEAVHQYIRTMSDRFSYPCYTSASVTKADGDRKAVDPELYWAPEELGDMSKSDRCRPGAGLNVHAVTLYDVTPNTPIVTDSVIADRNGAEIRPAAPGNVVPKLAKALRTDP